MRAYLLMVFPKAFSPTWSQLNVDLSFKLQLRDGALDSYIVTWPLLIQLSVPCTALLTPSFLGAALLAHTRAQ